MRRIQLTDKDKQTVYTAYLRLGTLWNRIYSLGYSGDHRKEEHEDLKTTEDVIKELGEVMKRMDLIVAAADNGRRLKLRKR